MTISQQRRGDLVTRLSGGLAVLTAYAAVQQSGDMAAPFLQEGNFWWLTGIEEPGWKVIIDGLSGKTTLVAPERSSMSQLFDGALDHTSVLEASGADAIIAANEFEAYLRQLLRKHTMVSTVYDKTSYDFVTNPSQRELYATLERIFPSVQSCDKELRKLRAIKQPEEIAAIEKAVKYTMAAFEQTKAKLSSLTHEYEAEAIFDFEFRQHGMRHAYAPIVAAGKNACTLHYGLNSGKMRSGQLVLMDIGARADGYAADITRTYVKGRPTKRQVAVHAAVESAHHDIINLLAPGVRVDQYLQEVDTRMKQTLTEVGLLKDQSDEATYRRYFPHAISHGLGVDVHDSLGKPEIFEENMVLTVEPGIYIPEEGIGVRIEDDILITSTGRRNLSAKLPTALE